MWCATGTAAYTGHTSVCVSVYLTSCSIQGLSYTRVVLSPNPFIAVHSLQLSPHLSVHSKYLYISGENYLFFLSLKQLPFSNFFIISLQITNFSFCSQF